MVVATDTMKNFIHQSRLEFDGRDPGRVLLFLGRRFFQTWSAYARAAPDRPGAAVTRPRAVPTDDGFGPSSVLFSHAARRLRHRRRSTSSATATTPGSSITVPGASSCTDQGHRQRLRRLRARPVHDPAVRQGSPALHLPRRLLALRRCRRRRRAGPRPLRPRRTGRAISWRPSSTSSSACRSST